MAGRTVRCPRVSIFGSHNYVIFINYAMHNHLMYEILHDSYAWIIIGKFWNTEFSKKFE